MSKPETDPVAEAAETPEDNPFLRVKAAFAASLPTRRYDFPLDGLDCHVTVGAMDAEAYSAFQRVLQEIQLPAEMLRNPRAADVGSLKLSPDMGKAGVILLTHSVTDFVLPRLIIRGGEMGAKPVIGRALGMNERQQIYRSLTPELFQLMIQVALEINHLDPNLLTGLGGAAPSNGASPD